MSNNIEGKNVSSVAGHKVRPGNAVYAATKTAVLAISEGLRQEVKPYNIRTTVISPGAISSPWLTVPGTARPTRPTLAQGLTATGRKTVVHS